MSSLQNHTKCSTSDLTPDGPIAESPELIIAARKAGESPPNFWDTLSKVWLTSRALQELDRRNNERRSATTTATGAAAVDALPATVGRFARRGGPDLSKLRSFAELAQIFTMSRGRLAPPRGSLDTVKLSSAYDKNFEQRLVEHAIYPEWHGIGEDGSTPEPKNLDDIAERLSCRRESLSPSRFPSSAFRAFKMANILVVSEGRVMSRILPIICGSSDIPSEGNLRFTNLDSITDGTTVVPVPDLYDGSYGREIALTVRQDLDKIITPTSHLQAPVVPNFFLEAKAPSGDHDVAKRQVTLDGALGARAMLGLHSYGEAEPVYHGEAHAFSSTYHAGSGTLQLYAHHITSPVAERGRPAYHMTQIYGYVMTSDSDTFRRGAAALRNVRDLAREQREAAIRAANARASQAGVLADAGLAADQGQDADSEVAPQQASHGKIRQRAMDTGKPPIPHQHLNTCKGSHEPGPRVEARGTGERAKNCTPRLTSKLRPETTRVKRARHSPSLDSSAEENSVSRRCRRRTVS